MKWTPAAEARLRELFAEGMRRKAMARDLDTSSGSITGKLSRLGLSGKAPLGSSRRRAELREACRAQQRLRAENPAG